MEKDKIINIKTSGENKPIRALRDELKESLAPLLNQNITNKNTGETAFITNKSIQKMRSEKAIKKSLDNGFTRNEHFEAVKNIKELFENSKKAFESEGKKQNDKNLKIHRYNADLNINDKEANALITIKEVIEQGKRIYSLELEDLKAVKFKS